MDGLWAARPLNSAGPLCSFAHRLATRVDGTLYYVHSDLLGSTVAVSDAAGGEVGRVQYDPYGEVLTSTLPAHLTDRLFTGQRLDSSTGLYYYNARYYDPHLGRFIQPDTLVPDPLNPQAWNRFSYCYNNPLRYTDPSGHQGEEDLWLPFRRPEGWSGWDVAITLLTFDVFAMQDWGLGQPRGTTTGWMWEQFEDVQAWQRRNIREPVEARFPVVKTINEVVESPEFQMGLMAAMMTANTFAPPGVALRDSGAASAGKTTGISPEAQNYLQALRDEGQVVAPRGSMSARIMGEISAEARAEVGLFRLQTGERVLVMGEPHSIAIRPGTQRIIAHTHPSGILQFSEADIAALAARGQRSSVLIDLLGRASRLRVSY